MAFFWGVAKGTLTIRRYFASKVQSNYSIFNFVRRMGLDHPFQGPHKPILGRLAAAIRATTDALSMGGPILCNDLLFPSDQCRAVRFLLSNLTSDTNFVCWFSLVGSFHLFRIGRKNLRTAQTADHDPRHRPISFGVRVRILITLFG